MKSTHHHNKNDKNHDNNSKQSKPAKAASVHMIQAMQDEVAATYKLLEMQQQETIKQQEHVTILESEIDLMKLTIENKQKKINGKNEDIYLKDEKIKELEKKLSTALIERSAFKILESQNVNLFNRFKEKEEKILSLEESLNRMQTCQIDYKVLGEEKVKEKGEISALMEYSISEYKRETFEATTMKDKATNEMIIYKIQVEDLMARFVCLFIFIYLLLLLLTKFNFIKITFIRRFTTGSSVSLQTNRVFNIKTS
jgi:hypothetical protein